MAGNEGDQANGSPAVLNRLDDVADEIVRRTNHVQWLRQFAMMLGYKPGTKEPVPMTPFRQGAMARLRQAARMIELLQDDVSRLRWQGEQGPPMIVGVDPAKVEWPSGVSMPVTVAGNDDEVVMLKMENERLKSTIARMLDEGYPQLGDR